MKFFGDEEFVDSLRTEGGETVVLYDSLDLGPTGQGGHLTTTGDALFKSRAFPGMFPLQTSTTVGNPWVRIRGHLGTAM